MIDWEGSFAGIPFGCSAGIGVRSVEGWLDMPDVRSGDQSRPQRHGLYPGTDLGGGRTITIAFVVGIDEEDAADVAGLLAAFEAVTIVQPDELPLILQFPGRGQKQALCRPRRRAHPVTVDSVSGIDYVTVEFLATDPRIYDPTVQSLNSGPSTLVGGLLWPALWPATWGTAGSGGAIAAVNAGNFQAPYVITFTGPATAPTLTHTGQGKSLVINHSLAAGETLVLDSEDKTVLLDGTASRYSWLSGMSQWFDLNHGTNALQFTDANTAARVNIQFSSASL